MALGDAVCNVVSELTASGSGSDVMAQAARKIFMQARERAVTSGGASRKLLNGRVKRSWKWHDKQSGKVGRPRGSYKVTDEQLKIALEEYSKESSRWSRKQNCPMRHLPVSKRRIAWKLKKQKGLYISRRCLAKRLQRGRLVLPLDSGDPMTARLKNKNVSGNSKCMRQTIIL